MKKKIKCLVLLAVSVCALSCSKSNIGEEDQVKKIGSTLNSKQALSVDEMPDGVLKTITAIYPDFTVSEVEKEFKHDKVYVDVEGEVSGADIEFDMLQTDDGWTIVEVQRDLVWSELPPLVANELEAKAPSFKPSRIIESKQYGTDITIYEFYAVNSAGVESKKEVKLEGDNADLLQDEWTH